MFKKKSPSLITGILLAALPALAHAEYSFNLPEAVTPLARDTMRVHNEFMLIIIALFLAALGIMVYSLIKHRRSRGHKAATFTKPGTRAQWLWVIAPFVGLFIIDYVVIGIPAYHAPAPMEDTRTDADMGL